MEKKTINLEFVNVYDNKFPFVIGAFRAKNGQMLDGYFLIDTGSGNNMLNREVERLLGKETFTDKKLGVNAIDRKGEVCPIVDIYMELDGFQSTESFSISQNLDFSCNLGKNRVIGILGSEYLLKHRLVVDYEKGCLRSSDLESITLADKSFFFPMEYGLEWYGIPVVGFVKGDDQYVCVADSGSQQSLIADGALEGVHCCENIEGVGEVKGISGNMQTGYAWITFSLLSLAQKTDETKLVQQESLFQILLDHKCIAHSNQKDCPPISALLSHDFMLRRKWILDYGMQAIYAN